MDTFWQIMFLLIGVPGILAIILVGICLLTGPSAPAPKTLPSDKAGNDTPSKRDSAEH